MTNHTIFFYPGRVLAGFALSLFDYSPNHLPGDLYFLLSLVFAIWFWIVAIKILVVLIKRAIGLG